MPDYVLEAIREMERREASRVRKLKRHHALYTESLDALGEVAADPHSRSAEELLETEEGRSEVLRALRQISRVQARRIYAVFFLGISKADVARAEKVSRAAVTININLGLKKISEILKK